MKNSSNALIILETPKSISIGFDNLSLKTGLLFKGIKEIPEGVHFLYTSLNLGKSSSFFYFSEKETIVLKWEASLEDYVRMSQDEESLYSASLEEFLPMMVSYPSESLTSWRSLTTFITRNTLQKLEPLKHSILSAEKEYDVSPENFESFSTPKSCIYYTSIPKRYLRPGLTSAEITELNFDKSWIFGELLSKEFKSHKEMLGEFQFAFISFLIGENSESFEQWKDLLILVCNCDRALISHQEFFIDFIPVIYAQVQNLPSDMVLDPFLGSSFITSCLKSFLEMLQNERLHKSLRQRGEKLKDLVVTQFGVSELEMINEEESPCVVDLN